MKQLKLFFALFAMLALGVGNAWGAEAEVYSADFTSVATHSYTQNQTFTLNSKSWTSSVSQVNSKVFYLGCNSTHKAKGVLKDNSTFSEIVTALKSVDSKYSANVSTAHAYAMLFDNAYTNVTRVSFGWAGGNNAFQVYLFGYSNSSWSLLKQTNYATSGTTVSGSVEWTGEATDYTKFAIVARPGTTTSVASTKTLRASTFKIYATEDAGGSTETVASLVQIAHTGDKTIFTEGDAFVKSTITATYDDGTTKDVTSLATFTGYDMNTTGTQTITVTYEGKTTTYDITVNPKPTYTITWNNAGSTTETTVKQGETFGELPTVSDCPNGKKFMGWTAATSVNNDGSDITYIKSTDKPTANTTYYAVFAVVEGDAGTPTTATVSISDYATEKNWVNSTQYGTVNIDANITATATGGGNTGKYYTSGTNWRLYQNENPSLTISAAEGYEIQTVKVTYTVDKTGVLTLEGSNVVSGTVCDVNAASVTFGVGNTGTATNGQVRITEIEVTYAPAAKKSDYSLNCDIHQDPYLTVLKTAIDFGTVAQNETVTETLSVSGGYLAEDVALTISGTNASFFSVNPTTIAKADEVDQDVTITYNPTATGNHTATLTIKTGDITKTVALSGTVLAPGKWALVTDASQLNLGDEIIIVAADANVALSTTQNTNNRGQAGIVKVGNTVNAGDDVQILTLGQGTVENTFAFSTGDGYLYAAGTNSSNHLKTNTTLDAKGSWAITIDNATGVATIKAQDSNTKRNWLRYNATNNPPIFSCYESGQKDVCVYRNTDVIAAPIISGNVDFTTETIVTITAQSGLTVYYTTNGNTPDKTATQYSAPFTISATTTVKAIAYDASSNASNVAEKTFTKQELVSVATAMALAEDEIAYFDEFEVVKVVAGKGNIYIKDASGHGLIYDNTLAGQLRDGDRVQGFVGISSPYNGLPEVKPYEVTYADLTITSGTPAEPYDFTLTVIAETDINKYIVFQNVEITENTDMSTNPTLTIGGNSVKFYNQFGVSKTLEAGKTYDIYGFVAVYEKDGNRTLQAYFYEAVQDGEVIQKYTVTYNAGGATGTVPVDNAEYSEGAQVYLKSATGLTYEGYEYKGWKVTDANGTEIPVESNKFNMPASNVTVTAQWEEIVVVPKKDFSDGYWVLVTDASELNADDYIVIAAAEEDFAMKSYESGNNCGQIEITKSANLLIWNENVGVFQLLASGSNYTIQDVNTKQYLYAAGTGTSNHLKATDKIPADEGKAKYVWTVSFTDGVPTVKATSDNRNTLMYNTGSDLFSCYSSGQKAIALYKYVTELPTIELNSDDNSTVITANAGKTVNVQLNRSFTAGDGYYTLCLPFDIAASEIGTAYTLGAITKHVSGDEGGININLTSVSTIEAGVPYLVLPKTLTNPVFENVIIENTTGSDYTITGAGVNVTFTGIINGVGEQTNGSTEYYVGNGGYLYNGTVDKLGLRAFFTITDEAGNPTKVRARVVAGENVETGIEDIFSTDAPVKVIENGQLIIIRDGVKYNVQGQVIE